MNFQMKIAGKYVEVQPLYDNILKLCTDYICEGMAPDMTIVSSAEKIAAERARNTEEGSWSDAYLETLSVYREISEKMLEYNTFLMHGSVVAVDGNAFMFTAASGIGKTTRTRLWLDQIAGSYVVNGDKPLIRIENENALVCGTPWSGKEQMNTNIDVPLRAIFILERAEKTSLQKLSLSQAFAGLFVQTYRPSDPGLMIKTLDLVKQLDGRVKFYRFCSSLEDADMKKLYTKVMEDCQSI